MQIKVYNGNQIGGCITIVESNKGTRICLDIGENLPSIDKKEVPEIDIIGLTKEPRNIEAVFVSHYHRRPYSDYMEKCLKIYLKHFNTWILLEFSISKTSPNTLFIISLSFIKALFVISLNLQLHEATISSKFIPSYWHPSSHKEAFGNRSLILSFNGISFFNGLSKS